MLSTGSLDHDRQKEAAAAIQDEADLIATLIEDVRARGLGRAGRFQPADRDRPRSRRSWQMRADSPHAAGGTIRSRCRAMFVRGSWSTRSGSGRCCGTLVSNACKHLHLARRSRSGGAWRLPPHRGRRPGLGHSPRRPWPHLEKSAAAATQGERVPGVGLGLYLSRRDVNPTAPPWASRALLVRAPRFGLR